VTARGSRRERLAEAIRAEIAVLLRREVRDPRIGFVTLTGADVSPDLTSARVYVTVLGAEPAREEAIRVLNGAAGFLQGAVFRTLRLRRPLRIAFVADDSAARGGRVEEILRALHEEDRGSGEEEE
jgi:ribosome-binding factor A